MRSRLFVFVTINLFAFTLWFASPSSASEIEMAQEVPDNPVAMSDESVAGGLKIYVRFCRACHGTGGVGDGPGAPPDVMPPNLVDTECHEGCLDGEVFNAIRNGVPPDYYMQP
jgi:mono/diheme cytochrome c family protein